jgi:transcription elongation factor GreA
MNEILFTASGFEKLKTEHTRLRAERETLFQRMRSALESGDAPPENGDYLDARHEFALLDRRLSLLDERLARAEVVAPRNDGEIELGERVTVLDLQSGGTIDYRVVGTGEGDPLRGEVSYESPIGGALLGRRVGDVVEAAAPGGRRRLEIVELDG